MRYTDNNEENGRLRNFCNVYLFITKVASTEGRWWCLTALALHVPGLPVVLLHSSAHALLAAQVGVVGSHVRLYGVGGDGNLGIRGEDFTEHLDIVMSKPLREGNLKHDDEPPLLLGVLVPRHAFVHHTLDGFVLDDFSRNGADDDDPIIQRLDGFLEATQRLYQRDGHRHDEVLVAAFKDRVFLLVQHNDDIAWLDVRFLIPLPGKHDLLAILHALLYRYLENLAVLDNLLGVALLAPILAADPLALSPALVARGVHL